LLIGSTTTKGHDIHCDDGRGVRQVHGQPIARPGPVIHDRTLRQPLEHGVVFDVRVECLYRVRARRPIPLRGARSRELDQRSTAHLHRQRESIASDDAGRRMNDDALAQCRVFRIEGLLHDERASMRAPLEHRASAPVPEDQLERRVPAGRRVRDTSRFVAVRDGDAAQIG